MDVKKVIKYRDIWMGIAILWIVFFHSGISVSNELFAFVKNIGYGGVDIFFLASGIGCFCSLDNNDDILAFMKRRVERIISTYWIFMIGWILYHKFYDGISLRAILGNILCVRNFTALDGEFNWYISAIWLMYLLAPLFKSILDKLDLTYKTMGFIIFLILLSICFWDSSVYIITVSRIPIFFIGMYMGKCAKEEKEINLLSCFLGIFIGLGILCYCMKIHTSDLWDKGYYWYPFILITPGLCGIISYAMELLKDSEKCIVSKALGIVGKFSFEIYLLHIWFFEILQDNLFKNEIISDRLGVWLIVVVLLIPGCVLLRQIKKIVMNTLERIARYMGGKID